MSQQQPTPQPQDSWTVIIKEMIINVWLFFVQLFPQLGDDHDRLLESLILAAGRIWCPLVVWRRPDGTLVLIDGHRRLQVWQRHQDRLPEPEMIILDFPTEEAAAQYVRDHLYARRAIYSEVARIWLKMQNKAEWDAKLAEGKALAKANQRLSKGRGKKGQSKANQPCLVDRHMADHCDVPVKRYKDIMSALRRTKGDPDWIGKILTGKLSPSAALYRIDHVNRNQRRRELLEANQHYTNPDLSNDYKDQIFCGTAVDGLKLLPDNCAGLIMTSPPYCAGKKYGRDAAGNLIEDDITYDQWRDDLRPLWVEAYRILRPGARLVIDIDSLSPRSDEEKAKWKKRPVEEHLRADIEAAGFLTRFTIHWVKANSFRQQHEIGTIEDPNMRSEIEYLLVFDKGDRRLEPQDSNQLVELSWQDLRSPHYTVTPWHIRQETIPYGGHPCAYPEELVRRVIHLLCPYTHELVVDCFCGSGTTLTVAKKMRRYYFGVDLSPNWCAVAQQRCDLVQPGDPIRGHKPLPKSAGADEDTNNDDGQPAAQNQSTDTNPDDDDNASGSLALLPA